MSTRKEKTENRKWARLVKQIKALRNHESAAFPLQTFGVEIPWDTPVASCSLAEIRAIQAISREHSRPLGEWAKERQRVNDMIRDSD